MASQQQLPMSGSSHDFNENSKFFNKGFDAIAQEALSFYHVPGLAIGIIHKGRTYAKGYGYSNLESRKPVTPNTLFYAGSTTKSFTAAALSLLITKSSEYKDIDWTTPISSIIPEDFVLSDDWATKHITFEDALCHRSGYPRHDKSYGSPENTTLSSLVRTLRHLPMTAEPRTQWQYQNIMYVAVSHAIEQLTGQPLGKFLRKQIWEPLGMESTFFTHGDAAEYVKQSKDADVSLATPYLWVTSDRSNITPLATGSEGDHFDQIPYDLPPYVSGAGANITSVMDYCKYLECMIRQAPPISPAAHAQLRKQRMPVFDPYLKFYSAQAPQVLGPSQYTLGWIYEIYAPPGSNQGGGIETWHHIGGLHGFNAEMRYIPALELGIVTLGNASPGAHQVGTMLVWEVINDLMGVERANRFDWKKENLVREEMGAKDMLTKQESLFEGLSVKGGPMAVKWEKYEGIFEHPAYARMTVSIAQRSGKEGRKACLLVTPSARTWNFLVRLTHVHEEIFMADIIETNPVSETNVDAGLRQVQERTRALFKIGQNGHVRSLGLELEPALAAKATEGRMNDWNAIEKGMIWFERVSE